MIEINAAFQDNCVDLGLLGRADEGRTRSIVFDCKDILGEYPDAKMIAVITQPCTGKKYSASLSERGTDRILVIERSDTAYPGIINIELRAIIDDDGNKRKSAFYKGKIEASMIGEGDAPGAPVRDVLDRLEAEIKQAQAVVDDIRQKLENGEFNGSDAEVTAENIQSALGYTPVKDVQVAGSSVLENGVANVPIAQWDAPGVVSVPYPLDSGIWNDNGSLRISYATDDEISSRKGTRKSIVCANMDYAVKAAMCDGKGAAWTSDEQKAAQERMGIPGDYELIEEITISEAITSFIRESTPDGTPYSLAGFLCVITSPGVDNAIILNQYIFAGETSLYNYGVRSVDKVVNAKSVFFACVNNKILHAEQYPVNVVYEFSNVIRSAKKFVPDGSPITKVIFNGDIPVNTKISIYGVRV